MESSAKTAYWSVSTGRTKTNGPNRSLCEYINHEETSFSMTQENKYEFFLQSFRDSL